jgi:hypothetical protein
LEYQYYARREIRNNYGMVEFQQSVDISAEVPSKEEDPKEDSVTEESISEKRKIFSEAITGMVYENTDIRSPQSSSFSSTLGKILDILESLECWEKGSY